jgi:hypothetical protein
MPEARDPRSIIEAAEQAAAAGNCTAAEDLLREAAAVQERTLGPLHPDLANTLNNLGVVCEMTDNPIDAEHYFRRAFTIAAAALPPDHPFVATSRQNLYDFCATRGRPVELPPSPPAVAAWLEAPAPAAENPGTAAVADRAPAVKPIVASRAFRPVAVGALSAAALLIVVVAIARPWGSPAETVAPPSQVAIAPAPELPAPRPAAPRVEPSARETRSAKPTRSTTDTGSSSRRTAPATSAVPPTIVTAELCTALRAWRCAPADTEVPPGSMFFYTQLKSATATTVEHRWYRDDRLHQAVQLRIQANPGAGYRTYSRNTISRERAGNWRVELRSADGVVLHEERFIVR